MANDTDRDRQPKVPTERPDRAAATREPGPGAKDRPGFDLGGSIDDDPDAPTTGNVIPGGPKRGPVPGNGAG